MGEEDHRQADMRARGRGGAPSGPEPTCAPGSGRLDVRTAVRCFFHPLAAAERLRFAAPRAWTPCVRLAQTCLAESGVVQLHSKTCSPRPRRGTPSPKHRLLESEKEGFTQILITTWKVDLSSLEMFDWIRIHKTERKGPLLTFPRILHFK